jgi:unsaturated rhamnogalacturonyl hydrolase
VADYELARFGAANANWVRAVFYTGLMAMWRAGGDAKYLTAARAWGQAVTWRLGTDSGNNPRWADNQACSQTYAELYSMDPGSATDVMLTAARSAFDAMVAAPMAGRTEWWWCDALFMAPPAMARVAKATGRTQYVDLMHTMFFDTKAFLYDTTQHLFWRDNSFRNTSFWSRGNGWVVAGTARVLEALPATDARRPDYEALLREMASKLRDIQGTDGFWRSDLLNPNAFPNPESSGTAFFTFGLAWGINHGVLDRATYLDTVKKGWAALLSAVDAQGRLGWVQAVGSKPGATNQADTNDYATGALLLAGEQMLGL